MNINEATGLSHEQYKLLLGYFWPNVTMEDADAIRQAQAEVLQTIRTPEELHQLAWSYNWDDGDEVPTWIIRQPFCDRGTALLIYWRASPGWFCQYANREEVSKYELDEYDLIKEIEARYLSGFYTQQDIHYDPTNDDHHDRTQDYTELDARQSIPELMKEPSPGRILGRASF